VDAGGGGLVARPHEQNLQLQPQLQPVTPLPLQLLQPATATQSALETDLALLLLVLRRVELNWKILTQDEVII
jgi:hypothetical protein